MPNLIIEDNGFTQRLEEITERTREIPTSVFDDIGTILMMSQLKNFAVGGRPDQWPPSKRVLASGGQTLVKSGALRDSGRISDVGNDHVDVEWGRGLPYAAIHQFGGTINHPGSDKLQVFQIDGHTIFTHKTRAHKIDIPARPYLLFQEEDVRRIGEMLTSFIIEGVEMPVGAV